jgi:hypothetical protein
MKPGKKVKFVKAEDKMKYGEATLLSLKKSEAEIKTQKMGILIVDPSIIEAA